MSFGFAVGDFLAVAKIALSIYESCKAGPVEYKELCSEIKSLGYALESLSQDAREPDSVLNRKGLPRKGELDEIISSCKSTMKDLQTMIDRRNSLQPDRKGNITRTWDAYRVGSSDLDSYRGKLTFHTSTISVFLLSLQGPAMQRIETKLDKIYARMIQDDMTQAGESTVSLASTVSILCQIDTHEDDVFAMLKTELLAEDISMARIIAHKDDIIFHMKKLLNNATAGDAENEEQAGLLCHQNSVLLPSTVSMTIAGSALELYTQLEASHRALQEVKAKLETRELEAEKAYNSKLAVIESDHQSAVTRVKETEILLKRMRIDLTKAKAQIENLEQELRETQRESIQRKVELSAATDNALSTEQREQLWDDVMSKIRAHYETQDRVVHEVYREMMNDANNVNVGILCDVKTAEKTLIEELTEANEYDERLEDELEATKWGLSRRWSEQRIRSAIKQRRRQQSIR